MKGPVNLTDQQWDLLRVLVSVHESHRGAEFYFARNAGGCGITYPGGKAVPGVYDETDLLQLRSERLVKLTRPQRNLHRGKPTQKGIDAVQRRLVLTTSQAQEPNISAPKENQTPNSLPAGANRFPATASRIMKEYEERLPLLASRALDQLRERGAERELRLCTMIESAAEQLLDDTDALASINSDQSQEAPKIAIREATKVRLFEIGKAAADCAAETVRDFAEGLLLSQGRLAVHADLLRDYTARTIREIRQRIANSDVFSGEPTLPWVDDPIAQDAIGACEELLEARSLAEDVQVPGRLKTSGGPIAWSPIVLEWETRKVPPKQPVAGPERIPEPDFIDMIAKLVGGKPDDVSEVQIERAALALCSHYESFQIIPTQSSDLALLDYRALCEAARPDSAFWKEREDEFRKHNVGENALLCAWQLSDDDWRLYTGGNMGPPSAEVLRVFKSLGREAAKGLANRGGSRSWIDWLELLSCAEDQDTGKRHYSVMEGSSYSPEKSFRRDLAAGEEAPRNALIEFRLTSQGGIEKGRRWYTRSPRIENLFGKSAGQCLELRSLVPSPWADKSEQNAKKVATVDIAGRTAISVAKIDQIKVSLDAGERKAAVQLRRVLEGCSVKELWTSAFRSRRGKESTKQTAYNRWHESRNDAPSWADELMKARLLQPWPLITSPAISPTRPY